MIETKRAIPEHYRTMIANAIAGLAAQTSIPFSLRESKEQHAITILREDDPTYRAGPFFHHASALSWVNGFREAHRFLNKSFADTLAREVKQMREKWEGMVCHNKVVIVKTKTYHTVYATQSGRLRQIDHKGNPSFSLAGALEVAASYLSKHGHCEILIQERL